MSEPQHPPLDVVRDHYDKWNSQWRDADFDSIDPEIRDRGQRVLEHLGEQGGHFPRLLEVGCGTGWLAGRLAPFGEVTAIDLSPRAIEIARERGVPAQLVAGDFLAHDFGPEPFDAVVVVETLFYVQDQPAAVRKIAQLLRPGGLALFTCINEYVYARRSEIGPPPPDQPQHWLSIRQMRELLADDFAIRSLETMDPRGDQGILRLVNSPKVNMMLGALFSEASVRRWKEARGWGSGVVIVAERRG